ncbi:MAG TPA: hypothetical protein VL240_07835 [Candidatus Binatia bacterium]|nr:hypothetical protein [Candidatus Binatia bacterium]
MFRICFRPFPALLIVAICFGFLQWNVGSARAQERAQRLILKDGSYQPVTKYEMQGDRVHYFSAERFEWEDVPASLVDWDATRKFNDELASGRLRTKVVETPEEREEREKEEANSPEIAHGVNLPGSGGVFLFDQFQGKPELAEIVQNGSEVDKSAKKKNVLRATINPLASSKQAFELKGEHAQVQSHEPRPTLYIDIDEGGGNEAAPGGRFRIVRTVVKKEARVVGSVKISIAGKVSEQSSFIPARVEKLGTGQWLKVTPEQDLAAGEYALVEMLGPQEMNLYVWDFGVNPRAPANPNTWQPSKAR